MNKKFIILGGGTAGLISALILKKSFPFKDISIIKSKKVGIVGVGESSTEQFAAFCEYCEIPKIDLILHAKSTFKDGVLFEKWADNDFFHNINGFNVAATLRSLYPYMHKCVANNRPKYEMNYYGCWDNTIPLSYFNNVNDTPTNQFHFDTYALNEYLKKICEINQIKIIDDDILGADIDPIEGNILSLAGSKRNYDADFFIDCSGFSRSLSQKTLGVKWKSYSEYLPLNSAISFATEEMDEYNIYTKSTARDYGWSWQIPTQGRTGNGYVFCDKYIDFDQAHQEMEKVYGHKINVNKTFKFDPGRLEKAWYKNCYSVGLSQSFVEPLEATAVGSVIQQMFAFIHYFPSNSVDECNKIVNDIYDNIFDYVQAHYLVKKEDTPFWKEVKYNLKLTKGLEDSLEKWSRRFPQVSDVDVDWGLFGAANYILILYGLDWFDIDVVKKEFMNYKHINVPNWEDTNAKPLYIGHKKLIEEIVKNNHK